MTKGQFFLYSSLAEIKCLVKAIKLVPFYWSLAFVLIERGTVIIRLVKKEELFDENTLQKISKTQCCQF